MTTQWRFIYPDYGVPAGYYAPAPDPMQWHRDHNGQLVTVVRRCTREEYDWMGDAQLIVSAADGTTGEVWHSELHSLSYPWPATHDKNGNPVCPGWRA